MFINFVHQFIDKNNDTSPDGVEAFLSTSSNQIILGMLSHIQKSNVSSDAKSKVKSTVASVFHRQIGDLVNTLDATRGSFIRCIKPNAAMAVGVFDNQYVVDQLRCQGIMPRGREFGEAVLGVL